MKRLIEDLERKGLLEQKSRVVTKAQRRALRSELDEYTDRDAEKIVDLWLKHSGRINDRRNIEKFVRAVLLAKIDKLNGLRTSDQELHDIWFAFRAVIEDGQ